MSLGVYADDKHGLFCPGCGSNDYAPTDPWPYLTDFHAMTGEIPWVVRAVCLDCGAATRATVEGGPDHYIPAQCRDTPTRVVQ